MPAFSAFSNSVFRAGLIACLGVLLSALLPSASAEAMVNVNCLVERGEVRGEARIGSAWYPVEMSLRPRYEARGNHGASVDIARRRACSAAVQKGIVAMQTETELRALSQALCRQSATDFEVPSEIRLSSLRLEANGFNRNREVTLTWAASCAGM